MLGMALNENVCASGLLAPSGSGSWASRWFTASRSSLAFESTANWICTSEKLWLDEPKTCWAWGSPFSALDRGTVRSRSTTAGLAPGSLVTMYTVGKSTGGKSSWFSRKMLSTPAPIKTNPKSRTTARFSRHQLTTRLTRSSSLRTSTAYLRTNAQSSYRLALRLQQFLSLPSGGGLGWGGKETTAAGKEK